MLDSRPLLVSVITPTLNAAVFTPDLLSCMELQSYARLEHLVVDGGSTDGTLALLERADPGRHRVYVRRDRSMYEAINYGIQESRGEVIACLNADDLYFPDTVELAVAFLERHPEVDIAYGDQLTIFTDRESFDLHRMVGERSDPWGRVLVYISQPSVFMRRRLFDQVGLFDPDLKAAGDFDFWIRAFRKGVRFKRVPRVLTLVRLHGSNLSASATWHREHELLKDRYLPSGPIRAVAEAYRLAWRKLTVNQLTLPYQVRWPAAFVSFHRGRYFQYLMTRRPTPAPILTVDLPYFRFNAHRALNHPVRG